MKFNIISYIIVLLLFAWSCTDAGKHKQKTESVSHENHDEALTLNNGKKWIINDEMKPFLSESEAMLAAYVDGDSSDYLSLARQLKEKNSGLIQSCTMDGKSHDELHKWLYPHIDLLASLEKAQDENQAKDIIEQLEESFTVFHAHFD